MTGTNFNLHKFICPVPESDSGQTNTLDQNQFKDYNHLKDLLKKGKKDMAKSLIKRGCQLNTNCADDTYDGTPLHLAVSLEYADIVELLLENGADASSLNDSKETPLILAAIVGNNQIIDMILSKIKPINYSDERNLSHLHIACMRNNTDLVKEFLVSGEDANKPVSKKSFFWSGFTPLHFAVEFKCIETAKLLLDKGAEITVQDSRGLTPLHLAFRKRNRLLTDLLLSQQYYYVKNPIDPEDLCHFQIACAFNDRKVVEDFLDKKIAVILHDNSETLYYYKAFQFAIKNECINVLEYLLKFISSTVEGTEHHLIDCAYTGNNEKILGLIISHIEKSIVSIQCQPSLLNSSSEEEEKSTMKRFSVSQYTELHVAVLQKNKNQISSILDACHPSVITVTDARGKTPLHLAFETNQNDLVDQLLSLHLELDENPVDSNNLSHFHISCATKNVLIIEDFIKKGVDINMTINSDHPIWAGNTPLHIAVIHRRLKVMKLLLDNGADFTLKNSLGISAYDLAIPRNYSKFIVGNDDDNDYDTWDFVQEILLANEVRKFEIFEDREINFLHMASINGDIDMINRLATADMINKSAGKNLVTWDGFTPLHFAAYFGQRDAVKVLLDRGADPSIQDSDQNTAAHYLYTGDIDDRMFLMPKNVYDKEAISTFHVACRSGNLKGVQHFLKIGADVHERIPHGGKAKNDEEGATPLHLAVSSGNLEVVKLLLESGADIDARDCYFDTPLHFCSDKEVLKILLDRGADPQALNCQLFSALEDSMNNCSEADNMTIALESWGIDKIILDLDNVLDPSTSAVFARYIERLTALGVDVDERNQRLYDSIIVDHAEIRHDSSSYKEKCDTELNSIKATQIDSRTTLYDLLFKNSGDMEKYSRNEIFQKIVEPEKDLRQKYPIYAYLIIFQFKKGQKRAVLLKEGKKSLSILMNQWIDLVFDMILQFMNDYEITYLNYAISGQNIFE